MPTISKSSIMARAVCTVMCWLLANGILLGQGIIRSNLTSVDGQPPPQQYDRETALDAQAWEYTPYRVLVWIVDDGSQVIQHVWPQIQFRIERDARSDDYNSWGVACRHPSLLWNARLLGQLEHPSEDRTKELAELISSEGFDKLIVIRVRQSTGQFRIDAREMDLMTRQWGELAELDCGQVELLPARCYDAVRQSFMPLARVERVADKTIYCRMRRSTCAAKRGPTPTET